MEKFLKQENKMENIMIAGKFSVFHSEEDVDPLAEYRRIYREHLKNSSSFSKEDAAIDLDVLNNLEPYLQATNQIM